jgi:hypothetical protein
MSAGAGSSTDPIIKDDDDDEKEEDDLTEQLSQMTVNELPKDLQKLIFEYKFKAETIEERNPLLNNIYNAINMNQALLNQKQQLYNRYQELYNDFVLGDFLYDYDDTTQELKNIQDTFRSIAATNNAVLENYEDYIQNYMRYTYTYKNNHRFG